MKLEPIYLLAPKPKPPSVPTRRAFLIAGGTFFAGIGLGGACGYAAGSRVGGDSGDALDDELKPTGDPNLDRLRWLAVTAPITELVENRHAFLNVLSTAYPKDETAWRGIGRLTQAALKGDAIPNLPAFAQYLSQVIERGDASVAEAYQPHIKALRQLR